ncbi:MAG: GGDEF domain-containing protein [Acidobacteria bacterium]|nr:GGDEF domain-containing protein [Acidobacteriota bacterium]
MISIFRQVEQSERLLAAFRALRKAYLELSVALPKAALPANPELSTSCKEELDGLASLIQETTEAKAIDEAGQVALSQVDVIYHANRTALAERDAALKDVVASVAEAISGFKGHGERHEGTLSRLADEFDSLARVDSVAEIRQRLRLQVGKLREAAQEMRRESDRAVQQFASQVSAYQQRMETARKETGIDRLTGLGSRREAEKRLRALPRERMSWSVLLFDIEGFQDVNNRYGTLFGDKLLRAFAHLLRTWFPEEGMVFRWGADEFLVVAEGSSQIGAEKCKQVCQTFAAGGQYSAIVEGGAKVPLTAAVAFGAVQCAKAENPEESYRRARAALEANRKSLRR